MTESMNMDIKSQRFDEDIEKVLDLLEEKAYFRARDEILKYNEVDIAEILEEVLEEAGIEKTIIIFRMLPSLSIPNTTFDGRLGNSLRSNFL